MSRYSPTKDGDVAFTGADSVLIIPRSAGWAMVRDLRRWARELGDLPLAAAYRSWAADLEGALNRGKMPWPTPPK